MEQFTSYVFCSNRKCSQTDCFRHITNAEYNTIIKRASFECDEKKGYPYLLLKRPEKDEIDANFQIITKKRTKK